MNKINKKEIQLELPQLTISGYEKMPKYSTFEDYLSKQFMADPKRCLNYEEIQLELSNMNLEDFDIN